MSAERPKLIPYRWTAQDVAGAAQKPAVIANPYGINPDEVFVPTDKPPPDDKRWAARFTDGEPVQLPASKCRLPYMLEQFFVPDHVWEEAPPEIQASTLGELCQKLADGPERYAIFAEFSAKAPAPKTPEARRTVGERKRALAKKLLWYWKNTDYRWALLHSGVSLTTIDQAPETLPTQVTATPPGGQPITARLTWVLARAAPMKPVGVRPHNKPAERPKPTTLRLPAKPSWNADPEAGSAFADLPEDLRETIKRSFVDRMCAVRGAMLNLDNAFTSEAQTAWDVLRRCSAQGVSLLVRLYRRIEAIDPSLKVWRQVKYLRNQWWGGSSGFKVVYYDPVAVRAILDGLFSTATNKPSAARDRFFYGLEHQREASYALAPQAMDDNAELPDCDTWREVDKPREEAVHFCVGKSDLPGHLVTPATRRDEFFEADAVEPRQVSLDDIHLDWFSPVNGVDPAVRKCNYLPTLGGSGKHWFQATLGIGKPTFYFSRVDQAIADAPDRVGADFIKRWEADKWKLAVRGKEGTPDAKRYSDELDAILGAKPDP